MGELHHLPERIVPRRYDPRAAAPARFGATLLGVAAAGLVDPARLRRGRDYVASGAVVELLVAPRRLGASVQGSRHDPYRVEIAVDQVPAPPDLAHPPRREQLVRLAPQADEMVSSCTCPDGYQPCKHVAAALLCFAEEVAWRPELLVRWRCGGGQAGAPRARAGSRATAAAGGAGPRAVASRSPFATPEWELFLAAPGPLPALDVPVGLPPAGDARLGSFDVAAWVRSAQRALQRDLSP